MYTNTLSAVAVHLRTLQAGSSFSEKAAALTLGPEGELLVCRRGWHEQKHRGGRTPTGFGLVGVKRTGMELVGNRLEK